MAAGQRRDLPDEVKSLMEAARARAAKLDMAGWRDELWRWHDRSLRLGLGLPSLNHKTRTFSTSDLYSRGLVAPSIARIVGPGDRGTVLRSFELPAIVLTLDAPDSEIRAQFEGALAEARRRFPLAFERPGRKGVDRALPWQETFNRWNNHGILPWAEFMAWRSKVGAGSPKQWPDARFAEWRGKDRSTVPETRMALRKAICNLPRLHHVLQQAAVGLDEGEEATAREWGAAYVERERAKPSEAEG